jgi:hypothetical protein
MERLISAHRSFIIYLHRPYVTTFHLDTDSVRTELAREALAVGVLGVLGEASHPENGACN